MAENNNTSIQNEVKTEEKPVAQWNSAGVVPRYMCKDTVCTIDTLIQKILDSEKQYDLSKIVSAYELAEKYHHDQKRESGEPYISHPLSVANILLDLGMDTDTICAALLHDVVGNACKRRYKAEKGRNIYQR